MNFLFKLAGIIALVIMITIDGFTDPTIPLIVLIGCVLTILLIGKKKGWTYEEM